MADLKAPKGGPIYQIKVTLKGTRPPIWRRFQVAGDISLRRLHRTLQMVMGWEDSHMYRFEIDGTKYGEPDPFSTPFPLNMANSRTTRLSRVIGGEGARLTYEYDFGDSWGHDLLVEKVLPAAPGKHQPVCLAGRRACPPEDCGGIVGYADLLRIINGPKDDQYEEMMEWLGGQFDPEVFDLGAVNNALRRRR